MKIRVEVVYAIAHAQDVIPLEIDADSTVESAVAASGLLQQYPEIDLARTRIGVWGRAVNADALLRDLDRVEIYRSLQADPKLARRRRAAKNQRRQSRR
jgi:putative ubiquitin-RnfH superfamily antitoxin RatB of RatAB toxin-antitoxin module